MWIHCSICGEPKVEVKNYNDPEKQKSLKSSVRILESIAICKECRRKIENGM